MPRRSLVTTATPEVKLAEIAVADGEEDLHRQPFCPTLVVLKRDDVRLAAVVVSGNQNM
jgi:hypothetical protein